MKSLELLAPARNAEFGMAAIEHGADAVYIGAPRFSARASAGNSLKEIERLVTYAHRFYARVYVALNTILRDDEIEDARQLITALYEAGADAIIIQDMGLLELDLSPIPLIASTQTHNSTPEKVRFLEKAGFQRVILARELSLAEIADIRCRTQVELECFVHGALCVSYSGRCYLSQAVAGRSGNRGVCAQPCRSRYSLVDGDGKTVLKNKHLLSLKDLNLSGAISDLVEAGITSFKIEGRYKDIYYVKNVTAFYRQALDAFMNRVPGHIRSSSGRSDFFFMPDLDKTFNRGYTEYFLRGRKVKPGSPDTRKSVGKMVGTVSEVHRDWFAMKGDVVQNGDGFCYHGPDGALAGFRVNTVKGNRLYASPMPEIVPGDRLYRNFDQGFARSLKKQSAVRRIDVRLLFFQNKNGIGLKAVDEDGNQAFVFHDHSFVPARQPKQCREQIRMQLSKLGETIYRLERLEIQASEPAFLLISNLNRLRRETLARLTEIRLENRPRIIGRITPEPYPYPEKRLDYHSNVYNRLAQQFYERHGAIVTEPAFECLENFRGKEVMTCRYCLKQQLEACPRHWPFCRALKEPLVLKDRNHVYELSFDCRSCRMSIQLKQ